MALHAYAVALDAAQGCCMTQPSANAAIWFAPDGFDPAKGVNGRRMAGDSFLRGWLQHARVDEWLAVTHGPGDEAAFRELVANQRLAEPIRVERLEDARAIAPVGTMFFSGPNFAAEAWRRALWGPSAYAICGITHTISTKAVMEGAWHLRAAPQAEWDAIICTSRAVQAALCLQMELIDDFLQSRFKGTLPPPPKMPVIPLGVEAGAFRPDPAARSALRAELGIDLSDCVALIVARLSPHEKFDPLPVYLALQEAQAGAGRRLHLILYGDFPDGYSRKVFVDTAPDLMPDVLLHHLPHQDAERRLAALSAADMFLFPIDNLQESFGIAPVEAMAAGLPVIASDWDGIRDTITPEVGFLIPTLGARAEHVTGTGLRYQGGTDSYIQYLSQISAVTQIDVRQMALAVRTLMLSPGLCKQLGAAGQARVRSLFDWSVVIPQMQALFAELDSIRRAADPAAFPALHPARLPVAPSPMLLFAGFPSGQLKARQSFRWTGRNPLTVERTMTLRNYGATRRIFEPVSAIAQVAAALADAGVSDAKSLATRTAFPPRKVERCLMWLLKYDYAERTPE
jgi:glycosyltransferase involved in cell wall biosynthesis